MLSSCVSQNGLIPSGSSCKISCAFLVSFLLHLLNGNVQKYFSMYNFTNWMEDGTHNCHTDTKQIIYCIHCQNCDELYPFIVQQQTPVGEMSSSVIKSDPWFFRLRRCVVNIIYQPLYHSGSSLQCSLYHCTGGWVDSRIHLVSLEKRKVSRHCQDLNWFLHCPAHTNCDTLPHVSIHPWYLTGITHSGHQSSALWEETSRPVSIHVKFTSSKNHTLIVINACPGSITLQIALIILILLFPFTICWEWSPQI